MKEDPSTTQDRRAVLVLGSGAWGTAIAMLLDARGHDVRVWGHDADYAEDIQRTRRNPKYLPDVEIPGAIEFSGDAARLAEGATTVFSVVPTQCLTATLDSIAASLPEEADYVSCSKGFEIGSLLRPSEILARRFERAGVVVLSGPSHAEEVSRFLPAALVAAADHAPSGERVQSLLTGPSVRVYTSADVVGVEIGGATKNVIAIACGIADGLGFGINTRSALMTRGLHEIRRLGLALGGERASFSGLSGMGDLVATCSSRLSRNYSVGERIGRGETLDAILASTTKVAEGVPTTRSVRALSETRGVDLPITREVHRVLFEGGTARSAVEALMAREARPESD